MYGCQLTLREIEVLDLGHLWPVTKSPRSCNCGATKAAQYRLRPPRAWDMTVAVSLPLVDTVGASWSLRIRKSVRSARPGALPRWLRVVAHMPR
jgi:hypothetical protein